MNIQQQIEQMLANASAPTTPGTGQQKQQAVANASAQKKATLGGFDPYAATVGAQEGTGYATATQQERDFRDMSTLDLWRKYGDAAVFQRAGANSGVAADQQAGRDWNQAAADTVSGVGLGAFNGLAGIGALGAGVVSTDLGNSMSRGIESVNEAVMDNQSPALQARRRLNQAMNVNDQRDSTLQYEQDIANGDSGFWAGTKRIGRDAGSAIANAAADPATLLDGTAQAVGSLIGVGPLTRIGGAVGRKLLDKGVTSGVLTKENAQLLSKLGEQGGTAALIGGMEAGGAFQQSVNEVLAMPFDKLAANSTEFNKLVDSGMSMVEAREVLANKVGLETAAKVAPAAIAMGKFVAKFEAAPMSTASLKASLGNIGTQVLEEAGQGGVAQIAGNDSIARNADSTRTLSEGVGEQVGTGALFGGLMAGGVQAPGLAARAAAAAGSRVMSAMPQAKALEAETAPAPSQSPSVPTSSLVPSTTDATQNAKAAAQLSDAQESLSVAASESIQNNPGLDEEQKAAQSYGMTLLESTFTFTDEDKAAVASSTRIPDDLKTKLSTARNLPEAFAATAEHALERTNKLDSQPMDQSYFSTVRYLDEMVERVEALAGNADISAVMEAATPGTPEAQYLASVYQSMANVQGSKLLKDQITMVRAALGKAPILEQANLDNVDEVLVRAKYAPHTLSHNSLDGVLGMDADGQLPSPLTAAQRTRLESARALVAALGSGRITKTVDDVTRQIAFNKIEGDGFKYPSLVEHTSTITDAAVRGDTDVARNELNHLRNFAQTLINKATAVNESAGTTNRVQYNNWIPSQNKWRVSAKGLNVDLKGDKSAAFGERIHTEAALASAVFTSMAEQFPELAAGIEPVTGVPAMAPALSAALANRQSATPAPTPAPAAIHQGQVALMPGMDYAPNLLVGSFDPAPNPKSRLTKMEDPLTEILEELDDSAKVEELAGKRVTKEKIDATKKYLLDHVRGLVLQTTGRISTFLASKSKSGTMGHWIAQAALGQVPVGHPDRAKAFQLQPNGKGAIIGLLDHAIDHQGASTTVVNYKLVSSAALAAGQWYLTSGNTGSKKLDEGSVATITGLPVELVTETLRNVVSQGMSYLDAIRGISDNIMQAWNLRMKDDVSIAQAEAVINSMAAELFATMVHGEKDAGALTQKFFDRIDIYVDDGGQVVGTFTNQDRPRKIPEGQKLITRYVPVKQSVNEASISTVLPTLLGVPVDDVIYFDPKDIDVSRTQQHSSVPLSPAERKAQERQQKTGFTMNLPFMKVFNLFSDKNMVDMLGEAVDDNMNISTRESAEGKNVTVLGGVKQIRTVSERITAEAGARGVEPDQVPVYYRFESISTARSMMRGRYNPQSDKGMRQAMTSMKSTADLTNPDHETLWNTAALQMMGERVYAMKPSDITPWANWVFSEPEMVAAIDAIAAALQDSESVTGDTLVPLIQAAATKAKDGLTNELIHVLVDRARYKLATPEQRKAFESRLYIEADGVANGPAGAVAMLSSLKNSMEMTRFIHRAAKTGFFIGQPNMNMNTFRTSGLPGSGVDTYAAAGEHASDWAGQRLLERAQQLANPAMDPDDRKALQKIDTQHKTVLDVMQTLLGAGNFEVITDPDTGIVSLKIARSVTKGPVTITVYGSGKKGIGTKLAGALMEELSARITTSLKNGTPLADQFGGPDNFKLFMAQMYTLTRNVPGYRDGKLAYVWNPDYKADKAGSLPRALGNLNVAARLKDFRLTGKEFASLAQNITEFYVEDLNKGIHSSLGSSVINNSTLMVQASNWQSLAAIHVYNTEIQKLIVSKVAADPNWDYVLQGFSKNDLKELRTKLKTVAPMLRTAMQAWDTTTSGRTPTEHQAGSTISGRFPVQHVARTPDMSGVKVAPYLVIGMGDAAMVTNLMNALDFPEGGMQVYDGINLPFMEAREGGVAANRAIADAWLTNNPLKTLATSFEAVANSVNWDEVITEYARRDPKKAELLESVPHPDEVLARLNEAAARVDALHATIKELGYSMDQMAATGATHSVEGTATGIEGDALEVLFTTTFEKHLGTKTNPEETDSLIADWPVNLDGTKVFNYADTFRLAGLNTVTAQDREIIRNVLRTHKDRLANLSVVMASNTSDLSAYLTPAQAARLKAGTTKGYWIEDSKTLILRDDVGGDTLAHELTHAATFQILRQFFENGLPDTKWGNAVDVSILAVTKLLYDYVDNGGKSRQLSHHASQKFAAFKAEIENILHTPESEPGATVAELWSGASQAQKAQAIAEFIAHVTTDKTLRSVAKSTLVSRIKDSVIRFLKLVVLGPLGMSNKVISNDVLSQLEFHTEVISAAQADMARRGLSDLIMGTPDPLAQVSLQDSAANEIAAAFRGRIGRYLVSTPQVFDQIGRTIEAKEAATTAGNVVVNAAAAGFLKTPAQRTAFVQIVATMSTLAKLSPAAIQAANRLYSESLDGLEGKLTPEQQDFIRGRTGLEVDAHDRSTLVPAFVGLGLVDPDFRAKLREVEVAGKAKVKGNVDERLQTIGNNALLSLQNMLSGVKRSKNVDDALAGLAEQVARQTALENGIVARAESMTFGAMGKANDWVVNHLSSKSKALSDKAAKVSNASKSKVVKTAATTTSVIANVFNDAGVQANSEAMLSIVNRGKSDILRSLVKDLTGRTESNAQVYDLIKRVGQGVSKARQFYREQLPSVVAKTFTNLPTDEQNKAVFKGIAKSDIASLVQNGDMTAALNTALDDKARAAEIARIEKELQKLTPRTEGRIRKKAKLLADFMNGTVKGGLLRNAEAVANLIDDNVSGLNAPGVQPQTQEVVDLVDKLISLYAVESMDKTELNTLKDLYKAEPEGVVSILGVLHSQLERNKARRTGRARFNAMKGYIPSEGEGSLVVRDIREDKLLRQMGYTKVADYKGTSLFKTSNMAYYYTPLGKAPFNQGIIQNARITAGGVDQTTGFAVGFPTAGRITQKTTVDRLAKNAHLDSAKEPLIAVFDENGKLVAFERSIDPVQLERLNPSTNTLAMLGQWMGRQAEEDMAQAVNFDAVAKVHDMWANGKHRAGEFVNVLDESAFKNNPVLQDALRLLPNDVKEHAQSLFGTGKFMVRTDMLNDVFGYRDASIGDAWTGNSHWSPETQERVRKLAERYLGQDAMRILVQGESRIKNLVKDAKTLIVVKSVIVPTANFIANIFQMLAQNIPLSAITRGLRDKTLEADFYTKTRVEQMEIAVKLMAMGNKNPNERQKLEARIQAIEDGWRGLSIWPLIQAGEFGSISDAGISRDEILLSEGKLQAYIEAKTEKLPEGLRRMGKWALITKDTALFQGLQKSMEYGDFLAKAIVYDHSLKKGMTQQDALGVVTDEFVNYDRHPGRFRGYVEDLGLAWFYNYKLRISKIAFRMLRKDPLRVALLAGMGIPGMELPVTENVFTKAIEGSLGFSLGPGMLFNAPGLNPWVAAMQ